MNSKYLKNKYKEIYENFHIQNQLVISLPFILNWAWDIFANYKWIRIKQKLPFRIYIGISKIKENKIRFKNIVYKDINENKFITTNLVEYAPFFQDYEMYFNNEYKDEIEKKWWIEINIISEVSRWVGLSFSSIVTLLFIVWLEKYYYGYNYITSEKVEINDFLNTNTPTDKIFRSSLKLSKVLKRKVNKVENQIASFFDSYYPIVSFLENIDYNVSNLDINDIKIYGYRLNSLEKTLSEVPFIPVDYGLIYSGRPVLTDHIVNTNENSYNWTWEIKNKLESYFWDELDKTFPNKKPIFYKTFIDSVIEDEIKETYWKLMWAISLEMLNLMTKLFSSYYTESSMRDFIWVVNKIRYWNNITRKSSRTFSDFIWTILDHFYPSAKMLALAPNDTSIMWWTAIFVMPLEWFRKELFTALEKTKEKIPWSKLLYANWLDWIENRWLIIEQDLDRNLFSEYISKDSYIIENNTWKKIIADITKIEENIPRWLTLDLVRRKMYIDWEKLTSKEMHSQQTTLDILEILLNNLWKDMCCSVFPTSSYTANKNEMLWKIILPLIKLLEEKKKIKFPLICKWSLNNFYLKLCDSNLEINVIKNLS